MKFGISHTHTHTTVSLLFWNMSGTTRVSRYEKGKTRKVKTNLDLLEQEIVSGSGICWAICKVCTSFQTTMPTSHHSYKHRLWVYCLLPNFAWIGKGGGHKSPLKCENLVKITIFLRFVAMHGCVNCDLQPIEALAFSDDGSEFICSHADGSYVIWSTSNSQRPKENPYTPYGKFKLWFRWCFWYIYCLLSFSVVTWKVVDEVSLHFDTHSVWTASTSWFGNCLYGHEHYIIMLVVYLNIH